MVIWQWGVGENLFFVLFFCCCWFCFCFYFILIYNTVLVLPCIDMNPPRVYMRSQTFFVLNHCSQSPFSWLIASGLLSHQGSGHVGPGAEPPGTIQGQSQPREGKSLSPGMFLTSQRRNQNRPGWCVFLFYSKLLGQSKEETLYLPPHPTPHGGCEMAEQLDQREKMPSVFLEILFRMPNVGVLRTN